MPKNQNIFKTTKNKKNGQKHPKINTLPQKSQNYQISKKILRNPKNYQKYQISQNPRNPKHPNKKIVSDILLIIVRYTQNIS